MPKGKYMVYISLYNSLLDKKIIIKISDKIDRNNKIKIPGKIFLIIYNRDRVFILDKGLLFRITKRNNSYSKSIDII